MARFSVLNRHAVIVISLLLAVVCGGFAALILKADLDAGPSVTLDEATTARQADLDLNFPGVEQTFLAVVDSREAETARDQAMALAASLAQRTDLFSDAFVPGTGPFYDDNALLFRPAEEVKARVEAVLQMQPLYQALAAAPDLMGLAALVAEIGRAVEQGRSPPGLEPLLFAASSAIEAEVRGKPRMTNWPELAGLGGETRALRWFVIATPRAGMEADAAGFARAASDGMSGVSWLWPRRALSGASSPLRDFIVPGGLSIFLVLTLLAAGLGSFRQAVSVLLCGGVTLTIGAAAAAASGRELDGATWSFAAAILAPVLVGASVLVLSFGQGRAKELSSMQSAMLAAQRCGGLVSAMTIVFAAFWVSWLVRQLPSLSHFAVIAIIGTAAAWLSIMTLLPAAMALLDRDDPQTEPHWLDDVLSDHNSRHKRNLLDIVAMIVLAAALFSAVFIPAVRFGERHIPSRPGPLLDTPDARGAIHLIVNPGEVESMVAKLSVLPEVGAIRTISQFLPPEAAAKQALLRELESFVPIQPVRRDPPDGEVLRNGLADLEQQLTAIAAGPATQASLRDAALRLRRAVSLFADAGQPDQERVERLEQALFSGIGDLSRVVGRIAALPEPRIENLSSGLRQRFLASDGRWRIEVMPKPGIGVLTFAAAMRKASPAATGEPVAALVRNEIIHHETVLALAAAAVAAAILALAALRDLGGWLVSMMPSAAFVTLTAAASALLDISLNAAMLAGASAAASVLVSASMIAAQNLAPSETEAKLSAGRAMRAALLPPLALAGAVAPLAISSRPAVSDLGIFLAVLLLLTATLCFLLVPVISRWIGRLTG